MIKWKKNSTTNDNCSVVFHILFDLLSFTFFSIEKKISIDKSRQKFVLSFVVFHILFDKKENIYRQAHQKFVVAFHIFDIVVLDSVVFVLSFIRHIVRQNFLEKKEMSWSWRLFRSSQWRLFCDERIDLICSCKINIIDLADETLTNVLEMKDVKCNNIYLNMLKLKIDFRKIRKHFVT